MSGDKEGSLQNKLFFSKFGGLNTGRYALENESPDCNNWWPCEGRLDQHGPRPASKSLVTSAFAGPVRLIKRWVGKDGVRNELAIIQNGSGYDATTTAFTNAAPTTITIAGFALTGIIGDNGAATLTAGQTYYSRSSPDGGGHLWSVSAPVSEKGVAVGSTFAKDYSEYGHITLPAASVFFGGVTPDYPTSVDWGIRLGATGADITLGAAVVPPTTVSYAGGANAMVGGYCSEIFFWVKVNGLSDWKIGPLGAQRALDSTGTAGTLTIAV
jgi:hypothetical protein